jgi:RecB family exonuclease
LAGLAPAGPTAALDWAAAQVKALTGIDDARPVSALVLPLLFQAQFYRYATAAPMARGGQPWALFGRFVLDTSPAWCGSVVGRVPGGAVFVPGHPDESRIRAWYRAWQQLGGRVAISPWPKVPPHPVAWEDAPRVPSPDRLLVVVGDPAMRDEVALQLTARGWPVTGFRPAGYPGWRAAWEAAAGDPADVLLWLGLTGGRVEDRAAVARAGHDRTRWPEPVRQWVSTLQDAREAVETASRWAEAGLALHRFARLADVENPFPAWGWDVWDGLGVTVDTRILFDWLEHDAEAEAEANGIVVQTAEDVSGVPYDTVVLWMPERWRRRDPDLERLLASLGRELCMVGERGPGPRRPETAAAAEAGQVPGRFAPGAVPVPDTVTGFERFGRCPLQYAWSALGIGEWVDEGPEPPPPLVGTWAHRALERLVGGAHAAPSAEVVRAAVRAAVEEHPPPVTVLPETLTGTVEALTADLTWLLLLRPITGAVETEVSFQLSWGPGRTVRGRLDRVERGAAGVLAVDYKTGRLPRGTRPDPSALQTAVYARAASERYGVSLEQVEAAYWGVRRRTRFGERRLKPPLAARWREAVEILAGMEERVRQGQCYPYPAAGACRTCAYRMACPPGAEGQARRVAERDPAFTALWRTASEADQGADVT